MIAREVDKIKMGQVRTELVLVAVTKYLTRSNARKEGLNLEGRQSIVERPVGSWRDCVFSQETESSKQK